VGCCDQHVLREKDVIALVAPPRSPLEDLAGAPTWVNPGSALVVGQATRAAPLTGAAALAWGCSLMGSSGPFHFAACQGGQRVARAISAFATKQNNSIPLFDVG
jgi:hypothetical protein